MGLLYLNFPHFMNDISHISDSFYHHIVGRNSVRSVEREPALSPCIRPQIGISINGRTEIGKVGHNTIPILWGIESYRLLIIGRIEHNTRRQ